MSWNLQSSSHAAGLRTNACCQVARLRGCSKRTSLILVIYLILFAQLKYSVTMPNYTDDNRITQGSVLSRYRGRCGLRRAKQISTSIVYEDSHVAERSKLEASPRSSNTRGRTTLGRFLRVWLRSP